MVEGKKKEIENKYKMKEGELEERYTEKSKIPGSKANSHNGSNDSNKSLDGKETKQNKKQTYETSSKISNSERNEISSQPSMTSSFAKNELKKREESLNTNQIGH